MSTSITITSQKGGVGKTTVALNLSVALAERGARTLLVDLDPQGAIGLSLARGETVFQGITEILAGGLSPADAVVQTKLEKLSLLPRGRLDPVDVPAYEEALFAQGALGRILGEVSPGFAYVVVDTPAGLGMVTRAALQATEFALVVAQGDALALRSIGQLLRVLDHLRRTENPGLRFLGILPTLVDLKNAPSRAATEELWTGFEGVFETMIVRSPVYPLASQKGLPVSFLAGPRCAEARQFDAFAAEVEAAIRKLKATDEPEQHRPEQQLL